MWPEDPGRGTGGALGQDAFLGSLSRPPGCFSGQESRVFTPSGRGVFCQGACWGFWAEGRAGAGRITQPSEVPGGKSPGWGFGGLSSSVPEAQGMLGEGAAPPPPPPPAPPLIARPALSATGSCGAKTAVHWPPPGARGPQEMPALPSCLAPHACPPLPPAAASQP